MTIVTNKTRRRAGLARATAPGDSAQSGEPDRHGFVRGLSTSGFHRIAYTDWGPRDATATVLCVHGLTRQGRDFDPLARALADAGYRVVCPDLVGRGRSDWLPNVLDYVFPQYCADMASLMASLGTGEIHWIGTSLGGLIGMVLAAQPGSPITRLVVNDIGPDVPISAVMRVGMRIAGDPASFDTFEDALAYNRATFAACGTLSEAQWRHFTAHSMRFDDATGRYVQLIDPKIGIAYQWLWYYQMTLWSYWARLRIPVLAIRGMESDFVPADILERMRQALPWLESIEMEETGHMPMLMSAREIDGIRSFLDRKIAVPADAA